MRCEEFLRLTELCELAISTDGRKLAYVLRSSAGDVGHFAYELFVTSVDDIGRREATKVGPDLRAPVWSPDGRRLAMLSTANKGATATVSLYRVAEGTLREHPTQFLHASHLRWMPAGRSVALLEVEAESLRSRGGDSPLPARGLTQLYDGYGTAVSFRRRLVELEAESGRVRELVGGDLWIDSFACSHDGTLAYCAATGVSTSPSQPNQPGTVRPLALFVQKEAGSSRQLTSPERAARAPAFAPDGSEILFLGLERFAPGLLRLFSVPVSGGAERRLIPEFDRGIVLGGGYGSGALFPMSSGSTVFAARDAGSFKLFRAPTDPHGRVSVIAGTDSESVRHLSAAIGGRRAAYVSTTSSGAQSVRVTNLDGGDVRTLSTRPALSGLRPLVPLEVTSRDGVVLPGWLIEGVRGGGRPKPLLVDIHGGSFSGAWSGQPDLTRLYHQELAGRGVDVLLLNARGSDGYGEEFATAVVGQWGIADAPDFHDAIDHLVGSGECSEQHVAVTGYSYGGFMANWLTATSNRFVASVSGGSICDFVSLFGTSDMGVALTELDAGLSPLEAPQTALERSPISKARDVRTPTLLLHGTADLRCPISQAEEWFAALARAGCIVELVRYPEASHGFLSDGPPSYVLDYGRRLVDWVSSAYRSKGRSLAHVGEFEARL